MKDQTFAFIGVPGLLATGFTAAAQARKGTPAAASRKTSVPKGSGAWTGSITYTRIQSMSGSKTVERVSGRGQDTTNFEMSYNYKEQVAVVASAVGNGSSVGKG